MESANSEKLFFRGVLLTTIMFLVVACANTISQSTTQTAEVASSWTPTRTLSPTPSPTETFTPTPTITPTPTLVPINVQTWNQVKPVQVYGDGEILNVSWSADGSLMAVCFNHAIRIYDANGWTELTRISSVERLGHCALAPDGDVVVSSLTESKTIAMWNPTNGLLVRQISGLKGSATYITFSPDGKRLYTTGFGGINVWNPADGMLLRNFPRGGSGQLEVSSDENIAVSLTNNGGFSAWSLADQESEKQLNRVDSMQTNATGIVLHPDGNQIAFGLGDGHIVIWDLGKEKEIKSFTPDECKKNDEDWQGYVFLQVAFFNQGRGLAVSCHDTIVAFDIESGKTLWQNSLSNVKTLSYNPTREVLTAIVQSDESTAVILFEANSGKRLNTLSHVSLPRCLGQNEPEPFYQYMTKIWSGYRSPNEYLQFFSIPGLDTHWTGPVSISPNKSWIAFGYFPQKDPASRAFYVTGRRGDIKNAKVKLENLSVWIDKGETFIKSVGFSQDSKLVTAYGGGRLRTWRLPSGELVSDLSFADVQDERYNPGFDYIQAILYTSDGLILAMSNNSILYGADPIAGKWLGKTDLPYADIHNMAVHPTDALFATSTCSSFGWSMWEFQSDRVVVVWGVVP